MVDGRTGDMEELRTCLVLQKLAELFIEKGEEMIEINQDYSTDRMINSAVISGIIISRNAGIKRLYFAVEESNGESNVKKNDQILKLC